MGRTCHIDVPLTAEHTISSCSLPHDVYGSLCYLPTSGASVMMGDAVIYRCGDKSSGVILILHSSSRIVGLIFP